MNVLCCRKLIHHRKETLARRSSSSTGHRLPSSNSEISLSQTPPPANGLNQNYGRQGSVPLSGSMDSMQGEPGFYQVTRLFHIWMHRALSHTAQHVMLCYSCIHDQKHLYGVLVKIGHCYIINLIKINGFCLFF